MRLTSRQHEIVKRTRAAAAGRGEPGEILLDGDHLLAAALDARVAVTIVLTTALDDLARRASGAGARVFEVTASVIEAASPVRTPSGVVALATWTPVRVERLFDADAPIVLGLV